VDTSKIRFVDSLPVTPGDSSEQRAAETVMIAEFSRLRGVPLTPARLVLQDGAAVQVDGVSQDYSLLCEAYAHQGPLKGGQADKVVADAFKLLYLARLWPNAELVLLFSDDAAARTFRPPSKSWVAKAVASFAVKIEVVSVPAAIRDELRQAQIRQTR
jgi:hypothetical protein